MNKKPSVPSHRPGRWLDLISANGGLVLLLLALAGFARPCSAATVDDFAVIRYTNTPSQVLPARLWSPRNMEPDRTYPLVIFLHGAGERGNDNRLQLEAQPAPLVFVEPQNQARWPCFMLAPQCPLGLTWAGLNAGDNWGDPDGAGDFTVQPTWPLASLMGLLGQLTNSGPLATRIDVSRVFITGLSMGGFGTWEAVSRWPRVFRGAVPICGGGDPRKAAGIGSLALWAFHAEDDGVVMVQRSRQMALALRMLGQTVRYTEFPASLGIGHGSWVPAYADPGLLPWMFGESRSFGGDGLYVEYFGTTNWSGTVRTRRIEPAPDLFWGTAPPVGVAADRFSARFTGQIMIPNAGRYSWRASADDWLSVWLDGEPLLVAETPMTNGIVSMRDLTAGRHDLRLEFTEITGRAWLRLESAIEGEALRPVVMDHLFSGVASVAPPNFDPPPGSYRGAQTIRLTCATPDAIIRYTTNGMVPSAQSPRYSEPFLIGGPALIRATATRTGMTNSLVASGDYQISPAILSSPASRVLAPGASTFLQVDAVGQEPLGYQWRRNGVALLHETNATLSLSNLQTSQSGSYSVLVSEGEKTVTSADANLFVGFKPTFLVRPQNVTALLGDAVAFSTQVAGTPPFQFTWRRGAQVVTNMQRESPLNILAFPSVEAGLVGTYSVTVTNPAGSSLASAAVRLTVLTDLDQDGLPDVWETQYGLDPQVPAEPNLDSDGDGRSDRAEYLAGTNPRVADDFLSLRMGQLQDGRLELSFAATSNRTYRVLSSAGLENGATWQPVLDLPALPTNRAASVWVTVPGLSAGMYYRVTTPALGGL